MASDSKAPDNKDAKQTDNEPRTDQEPKEAPPLLAKQFSYFRNPEFSAQAFYLGNETGDPTKEQTERFVPFVEKFQGDSVKVGYLRTKVLTVIERCEFLPYVEEIKKEDWEKSTNVKRKKNPAVRAKI